MNKPLFIKGGILALPVLLFGGLLWNYLGLSGHKTVHYTVGDSSPFIQSLLPDARVGKVSSSADGKSVKILDEPVYFSVFAPPGNWQTAQVSIAFKAGNRAVLELGALKDLFAQAFDFRPLANTVLEGLDGHGWTAKAAPKLGQLGVVYSSDELLTSAAPLKNSEVATYKVQLPWAFPNGQTTAKKLNSYKLPLQGPHELFTAIGDGEALNIAIKFFDTNLVPGADEGAVRVYTQSGEMVAEQTFADDGNVLGDALNTPDRGVTIAPEGLPGGVYRIVLSTTSDIIFDQFDTYQNYLMVKNTVNLAPGDQIIALKVSAKRVTLEPLAATAFGTVVFGANPVTLDTVRVKSVVTSTDREISALILPGGGVRVTGEGFYSLAGDKFFTPEPAGFTNFVTAPQSFKIVAANVPETKTDGSWRVGSSTFELSTLAKERGAYKFVLSVPLVNEPNGGVDVHGIDITFSKPPLTFRSFLSSLKSFLKDLIW